MKNIQVFSQLFNLFVKFGLTIGFIICAIYFISIDYVPVANISSFAYLLLIIALLGIFALLSIILNFIIAPLTWLNLFEMRDVCYLLATKQYDDYCHMAYKSNHIDIPKSIIWRITLAYIIPVFTYVALVLLSYNYTLLNYALLILGLVCTAASKFIFLLPNNEINLSQRISKFQYCQILLKIITYSFASGFYITCYVTVIWLMYHHANPASSTNNIYIISFAIIFISSICLTPPNDKWNIKLWMGTVGACATLIVFVAFSLTAFSSGLIIRGLNLGNLSRSSIVVNKSGCEVLRLYQYPINCENQSLFIINNIQILWRVGEYYVKFRNPDNSYTTVTLAPDDVTSIGKRTKDKYKLK